MCCVGGGHMTVVVQVCMQQCKPTQQEQHKQVSSAASKIRTTALTALQERYAGHWLQDWFIPRFWLCEWLVSHQARTRMRHAVRCTTACLYH